MVVPIDAAPHACFRSRWRTDFESAVSFALGNRSGDWSKATHIDAELHTT